MSNILGGKLTDKNIKQQSISDAGDKYYSQLID